MQILRVSYPKSKIRMTTQMKDAGGKSGNRQAPSDWPKQRIRTALGGKVRTGFFPPWASPKFAHETSRKIIVDLLSTSWQNRRTRRNRKTRYRKPRFANRKRKVGWLAPSVQNKVDTHLTAIRKVHEILPVSQIIVEVASFDIQKVKHHTISGSEYQEGWQFLFLEC